MTENTVYEDKYFEVISPVPALHCRDDGGHLILIKKEKVHDRSDMTWQEAIDFMRISMAERMGGKRKMWSGSIPVRHFPVSCTVRGCGNR